MQTNLYEQSAPKTNLSVVNVGSVPQRSVFRYPGGKTWFIPLFRKWMRQVKNPESVTLIEPFCGGGSIGLTCAFEQFAKQVILVELDPEIAAVWQTLLGEKNEWLADAIKNFDFCVESVNRFLELPDKNTEQTALATLLKNRTNHGGILAKGAGVIKKGENGKGIASRWYPETLRNRILAHREIQSSVTFMQADGFEIINRYKENPSIRFFIDPPYWKAGKRLYTHSKINHRDLFELITQVRGDYLVTYDAESEIIGLAEEFGLTTCLIPMKTTQIGRAHV